MEATIGNGKNESPLREQGARSKTGFDLQEQEGEQTISTAPEDVKTSGNAPSAYELRFFARAEAGIHKLVTAIVRNSGLDFGHRLRAAQSILFSLDKIIQDENITIERDDEGQIMNTYINISYEFWTHPKTRKLIKRLGLDGVRSLQILWAWAAKNRPDGILSGMDWEDIELAADWKGEEMAFFGQCLGAWLDETDAGYALHGWNEHGPKMAGSEE